MNELLYVSEMWDIAKATAKYSKDPSTKVGAVATVNRRVIGTGRNGFPPGIPDVKDFYENRSIKHLMVKHAEENLISICGDQIRGGDVFVTFPVCNSCAGMLITSGIKRVFCGDVTDKESEWGLKWELSKSMFSTVGVEIYVIHESESGIFYERAIPQYTLEEALNKVNDFFKK